MKTIYIKKQETYKAILNGTKTIELRLYTPFFQNLKPNSILRIQWHKESHPVRMIQYKIFDNFKKIDDSLIKHIFPYHHLPTFPLHQYYHPDKLLQHKLIGLYLQVIHL